MRAAVRRIPPSVGLVGLVIALVPWFPYPGRTVADTKLDLVVDPWGYLARSQSAWDSHAFFGQLQNQAYGYLFPMGPFFGIGRSLHIPEWVVQRGWWTVVLVTAFAGAYLLCRRLEIGGRRASLVAAVAFAVSPHAVTVLGPISVEQWPSAMTPWLVLASLRLLERRGRDRLQAAALLAVTCAAVGGVNATATLAAIAVAAIFVLTAGRRGLRTFPLWCLAVLAGTAWWAIPLVVLGVYAYPFLDFIETSSITTAVTSVPNVLRGASHWVAYVGWDWPAGSVLAAGTSALLATTAVAVFGITGLAMGRAWRPASHARTFAIVSLLAGLTIMGVAYGASLGLPFTSPFAGTFREALDGSLAAFRNVHKFDAMVRLPICLGLAALLSVAGQGMDLPRRRTKVATVGVPVGVAAALVVTLAPAASPDLAPRAPFETIPKRWHQAAETVDRLAASDGGATLVAPATRFGEFTWGNVQEDPLETLAESPVVQRDAIPLGSPGAIRVMDALDGILQSGGAQPGLVDMLARMGIGRVVVPHDTQQHLSDPDAASGVIGTDARTEDTLRASGLTQVAAWGKGQTRLSVWSTERRVPVAEVYDLDSVVGVTGGPEALVSLAALGAVGQGSAAYAIGTGAGALEPTRWIQTDTLRRRSLNVAATVADEYTATLQPRESRTRRDFPPAGTSPETTRGYQALRQVSASSTAGSGPSAGGAAALDNDYDTAWTSAPDDDRPTVSLTLARPSRVGAVSVRLDSSRGAGSVRRVELIADGVVSRRDVAEQDDAVSFPVDATVTKLRVRLVRADPELAVPVGVADIAFTGLDVTALLDLPAPSGTPTDQVVVARDTRSTDRPEGRRDEGRVLARRFTADRAMDVSDVLVTARSTPAVERLLDGWTVSGPRLEQLPRTRPGAALDGDPATRWTIGYLAGDPSLTVELPSARTITGLKGLGRGNRYQRITGAVIRDLDSGQTRRWSSKDRSFAPLTARRVRITFDLPRQVSYPFRMPDVTLEGAGTPPARRGTSSVEVPCAAGVVVAVGESTATYTATLSRDELLDGSRVAATRCAGPVPAAAGRTVLRATSSDTLDADVVRLGAPMQASAAAAEPRVRTWTDRQRDLVVAPGREGQIVAWHEGFNPGWEASLDGRRLEAVEIDGWRQGFVVPAGAGGVLRATFAPDTAYRAGLLGGGFLVVLMGALAFFWRRPRPGREKSPLRTVRVPAWSGRALAVVVPAVLGGLGGVLLGLGAAVTPPRWRMRAIAVTSVVLVVTTVRWPQARVDSLVTVIPQASGLLLIALLAAALVPTDVRRHERPLDEPPRQVGDDQRARQGQHGDHDERSLEQVVTKQGQ
nr:alpha-(1->3)-arabinofuranosyltransferase family protein [Aeromicrobium wangtongii]